MSYCNFRSFFSGLMKLRDGKTFRQLIRYGAIGLVTNAIGYFLYFVVTNYGISPKKTMTILYGTGAMMGFLGNRTLTFSYEGGVLGSGIRYSLSHLVGYFINLAILVIFVDRLGYAHQIVQAIAILVVAAFLFVSLKFFVFRGAL